MLKKRITEKEQLQNVWLFHICEKLDYYLDNFNRIFFDV